MLSLIAALNNAAFIDMLLFAIFYASGTVLGRIVWGCIIGGICLAVGVDWLVKRNIKSKNKPHE